MTIDAYINRIMEKHLIELFYLSFHMNIKNNQSSNRVSYQTILHQKLFPIWQFTQQRMRRISFERVNNIRCKLLLRFLEQQSY